MSRTKVCLSSTQTGFHNGQSDANGNAIYQTVIFDTVLEDDTSPSAYNSSMGCWTADAAGIARVEGNIVWEQNAPGAQAPTNVSYAKVALFKNDVLVPGTECASMGSNSPAGQRTVFHASVAVAQGDEVEIRAWIADPGTSYGFSVQANADGRSWCEFRRD